MMNVYGIYVSSISSGDVEIVRTCSRYSMAVSCIKDVVEKYIEERSLTNCSIVVDKKDFSMAGLSKNKKMPNGYCFKKSKDNVTIFKKTTDLGYLRNSVEIIKEGRIGICDIQIKIPTRKSESEYRDDLCDFRHDDFNSNMDEDEEFDIIPTVNKTTYYEHGKHVSFIEELKQVMERRRTMMHLFSEEANDTYEKSIEDFIDNGKHEELDEHIEELREIINTLNRVPEPVARSGYVLGKVVKSKRVRRSVSANNLVLADRVSRYSL